MAEINPEGLTELKNEIEKSTGLADSRTIQEIEAQSLKNVDYAQNIEQRRQFARLIFRLVCIWLFIVLAIVIASGLQFLKLSDTVLSLLLGTTTANVCSFLFFVVKYLFNVEGIKELSGPKELKLSKKSKQDKKVQN